MSNSSNQVAVVGCGYWGKNIVRNFSELDYLAAISDPDERNTAPLAEKYNVPILSFDKILADDNIGGVVIAAPAPIHAKLAIACLEAGKHVMVEKPIALSLDDAQAMVTCADENNRLLMVGHLLNYHSAFLKVVEIVQSGKLGKLRRIYSNRLSFGKVRTEENVLWSFAPHDLSMILRLADGQMPETVDAHGSDHVSDGLVDFCHVQMSFTDGLTAHTFVSWLHPYKEQKLVVIGEDAMVVFDDTLPTDQKVALYQHKAAIVDGEPVLEKAFSEFQTISPNEPLKNECRSFVNAFDDPSSIYTNGEEGMRVLKVLTQAEESMAAKRLLA